MFTKNKRLIIAFLFASVIAVIFWSQSRIPALNEKAQMGLRTNFGEIAFNILLPVSPDQIFIERVIKSSINWAYTNMIGMTFGLLFAAAALTILSNLKSRSFRQPWLNTLSGVLIGAPLGVCVNCATPIAFGIYSAGARLETALATLIASPTLNIIVLTMSFTLLPWQMALSKLLAVLITLSFIPLLVKHFPASDNLKPLSNISHNSFSKDQGFCTVEESFNSDENYFNALLVTSRVFVKNLFYIVRFALPLMLLAGFLGALVIEVVPFNFFENVHARFYIILACALVATILPVPIAFDVIIVTALVASGIDKGLATTLLIALGIYSIYPAFIIARYISKKLSVAIAVLVIIISSSFALYIQHYFEIQSEKEQQLLKEGIIESGRNIYKKTIQICEELPHQLQQICFETHIEQFNDIVSYELMCTTRPSAISQETCNTLLKTFNARKQAISNESVDICLELTDKNSQANCIHHATIKIAVKNYDINVCDKLLQPDSIRSCKDKYLNANLLFNPDNSACKELAGKELDYCQVNAEIYKLTDTMNIKGCDKFDHIGAGDHCRYTIALAMIGRHNDTSGCATLKSPHLTERCHSLVASWKAVRETSYVLCSTLNQEDLKNLCLLRVSDKKISSILAKHSLAKPVTNLISEDNNIINQDIYTDTKAPALKWNNILETDQLKIEYAPYTKYVTNNQNIFKKVTARSLGISKSWEFRMTDFFEPFIIGKGIASGDFNNDYWPDIVLATEQGVALYKNVGGKFEHVRINQDEMQNANLFLVALVDINNDGRQDIFASSYGGKNFLLKNIDGDFKKTELAIIDGEQRLTLSAGFGDINQDGILDIVLGNWSSGVDKLFDTSFSGNQIMFSEKGSYRTEKTGAIKGETNSVLITDINNDNLPDVLIANDRLVPDVFFINDGQGKLKQLSPDDKLIPITSMFTMSIDSADFNNDLKMDLFSTDMTFARSSRDDYCAPIQDQSVRNNCKNILLTYKIFLENSAVSCKQINSDLEQQECFTSFSVKAAKELKDPEYCSNIVNKNSAIYSLCIYLASPSSPEQSINQKTSIEQTQRNTLLIQKDGIYDEQAESFKVTSSYWSWNAKSADLDNDGWQDIYVGNGFHFGDNFYEIQENILFHNVNGNSFEEIQSDWGLNDTINTPSYTYIDIDLDGDLDIIATGVLAPPRVYLNQLAIKNSISFALIDEKGNSFGIGAKITIRYGGEKQLKQQKENKLSGGFMSFDNPVVHFGLDQHKSIDAIEIKWPDGEITIYDESLIASGIYRIKRTSL
ncbi:MAG: hypothetical protein HND53_14045 [Proteobacteria bacterium]|nr:hypothetical protein [Pseudomonadota bacterium]NOG61616.1 hypothetical protein [Pseudomonadota bacterium]